MRVYVSQADIDNGSPFSACKCALALAINRAFLLHDVYDVEFLVGNADITWEPMRKPLVDPLPIRARLLVKAYDLQKAARPMSFTLEVPDGAD